MGVFSVTEAMVGWVAGMGYRACTYPPADPPEVFVTIERTGGGIESYVDHATIALQVWAGTPTAAESVANDIRLAMLTSDPPGGIHSVRVTTGPYPFYDESTRMPRYQMVLDIACQLTTI